jgi:hypothetical protein
MARPCPRSQGACANAGSRELAAEFPWEPGAVSAMMGHRTSLLRMNTNLIHPLQGNGLLVQLHIPVGAPYDAGQLSNDLNLTEASAVDTPPTLGAWCGDVERNSLAHVSFWPKDVHWTGDLQKFAVWMMTRMEIVRPAAR